MKASIALAHGIHRSGMGTPRVIEYAATLPRRRRVRIRRRLMCGTLRGMWMGKKSEGSRFLRLAKTRKAMGNGDASSCTWGNRDYIA